MDQSDEIGSFRKPRGDEAQLAFEVPVNQAPDLELRPDEERRYWRIRELLEATNLYTPQRAAVLLVLTDDDIPSPIKVLAEEGLPLGACGTTAKIFERAARYLGTAKIDRERRDYHVAPLRRPGTMIEQVQVPNKQQRAAIECLIVRGWPTSKNQYTGHRVTAEVRKLLAVDDECWANALTEFLLSGDTMRERQAQAGAAAKKVRADCPHAELIRMARDAQIDALAAQNATYSCIYIDDTDGDRVSAEEAANLKSRGLSFGGNWRYPDALLVDDDARQLWIIDAVVSDGEVDENRVKDFIDAFAEQGWKVAGFTTVYRTWAGLTQRQSHWKNLAYGTNVWIAEDGGRFLYLGPTQGYRT